LTSSLIQGRRIKTHWIYRKAAKVAKGRKEDFQKTDMAIWIVACLIPASLRFLGALCGFAVKII
jgi:hypothetical protein